MGPRTFYQPTRSNDVWQRQRQKSSIRPLHDRVIVSRIEEGEQKVGGIIIPDSAKEKPQHLGASSLPA